MTGSQLLLILAWIILGPRLHEKVVLRVGFTMMTLSFLALILEILMKVFP